jgi:hypothetical protein
MMILAAIQKCCNLFFLCLYSDFVTDGRDKVEDQVVVESKGRYCHINIHLNAFYLIYTHTQVGLTAHHRQKHLWLNQVGRFAPWSLY